MDNFRTPARHGFVSNRSLSISSLTMRDSRPRLRHSVESQGPEDSRRKSFRNRSGAYRPSNSTSPGWSEVQGKNSRKISDIYKNPQLYTGVWQNQQSAWNFPRTCLQLVPAAIAVQFCAVSSAVLSAPNLVLLDMPLVTASLTFLLSGILGATGIFVFRILVKRFYYHRRKLVNVVCGYLAYLAMGVLLVFLANVRVLYIETFNSTIWDSASTTAGNVSAVPANISASDEASRLIIVPLIAKIFALVGFSMIGSALGSGQYLLQSVAVTSTHSDRHQIVVTIATVTSAGGGSLICILGCIDFSVADNIWRDSVRTMVLLCGVNLALLLLGAVCFLVAWCLDTRDLRHSLRNYSAAPARPQRTSRTPQEIFDECAHLLGHHTPKLPSSPYHSRPPKYYDPSLQRFVPKLPNTSNQGNSRVVSGAAGGFGAEENNVYERQSRGASKKSTSSLLDRQETLSTTSVRSEATLAFSDSTAVPVSADILKRYNYAVPQRKGNSDRGRRGVYSLFSSPSELWKMVFILALVFCLSSSMLSFEYTATSFLLMSETSTSWNTIYIDMAVRKSSSGLLFTYVAFAMGLLLSCKFLDQTGWKKPTLAICLVSSLLTLLLALLRDSPGLFLPAAFSHGLLKTMVVAMPHLLTLQTVRSQGGHQIENRRLLLIESPTCILWSLTPTSLALVGTAAVPLAQVTGRAGTSMMYSAISGFLACLGLIAIL